MIEGESGILAICGPDWRPNYEPSKRRLTWPNGSKSLIFTADEPERLRGKQHQKLWADELCSWRYPEAWDQAQFGLRLGKQPQAVVTTTPRPIQMLRELMKDAGTVVTRGSTKENAVNLAATFLANIVKKYQGTRLGRQELDAEVLEDNPDALFHREDIERARVKATPDLERIVVGVDPAGKANRNSALTGIVAAGTNGDHGYVLADKTLKASPLEWGRAAVDLYKDLKADRIVAETNNGGDMVESTIHTIDPNVPVTCVTATRGKAIRAEPVAALYEQGRIHHVGMFRDLEDQQCEWNPLDKDAASPDRMDALVWAFTELMIESSRPSVLDYYKRMAANAGQQRK
jgi:phage terminase large subunit-like protein